MRKHRLVAGILVPFGALIAVAWVLGSARGPEVQAAPAAGTIYVDASAPGPTHDGTSWNTAFADLQSALDVATAGYEVWVAAGL